MNIGDEKVAVKANPLNLEKLTDDLLSIIYKQGTAGEKSIRGQIRQVLEKHLKQLAEFCLRYRGKPELLIDEHPEFKKEAVKYWSMALQYDAMYIYNTWLLEIAFGDVLGKE